MSSRAAIQACLNFYTKPHELNAMPLQDLTPQLRTRLSRVERTVGWFVFFATVLLLIGFAYYVYNAAESRGWFKMKVQFHTYVQSSEGLNVGDKVLMMGFAVGEITEIHAMPPRDDRNVRIEFRIVEPYFRYIWTGGSVVKVNAASFLGRQLEVTRATNGYSICVTQPVTVFTNLDDLAQDIDSEPGHWQLAQEVFDAQSNLIFHAYEFLNPSNLQVIAALHPESITAYDNTEKDHHQVVASWHPRYHRYENFTPNDETVWLPASESPAVSDQLQAMVTQVQNALPGILALTNRVAAILDNATLATSNLNVTIAALHPLAGNLSEITGRLRNPGDPLTWALGTNGSQQVQDVLTNANALIASTDSSLDQLTDQVGLTLVNAANITSNLAVQVQSDPTMLFGVSKLVLDTDDFVQGLKRHWLLRSAFKKENEAAAKAANAAKAAKEAEDEKKFLLQLPPP